MYIFLHHLLSIISPSALPNSIMFTKKPANIFLIELMQKWQNLKTVPNVFSYQLEVTETKLLPGKYEFHAEYNPKRTTLRRPPQTITSLNPQFDEKLFNFKKVAAKEVLMKIKFEEDNEVSIIINNSPLSEYHTLICPNVEKGLPQRITLDALRFCVAFMMSLEGKSYFRIGYNSPGALASVNHLHLHLILIEKKLYIDRAKLQHLFETDVYRLDTSMPTEAICFIINSTDTTTRIENKVIQLYEFLIWLCNNNIPHNIFMTSTRQAEVNLHALKIFVYARESICVVKDPYKFNLGFCEFSGLTPLGSKELYDSLTDQDVIAQINSESGRIYDRIYKYFK